MASKKSRRHKGSARVSPKRRLERAIQRHDAGDFVAAEKEYDALLKIAPGWGEVWHAYGVLALHQAQPAQAVARLLRAVEIEDQRSEYLSNLGAAQEAVGDLKAAKSAYDRALRLEPDNADTVFNAGLVSSRLNLHEEAKQAFARVVELAPRDAEAWLNLSRAELALGDEVAAGAALARGEEIVGTTEGPMKGELLAQHGAISRASGRYLEAAAHYEAALERLGLEPGLLANLGAVLDELGQHEEAEAHYVRALERLPGLVDAALNLARLYERSGRLEKAFACLRTALRSAPEHSMLRRTLARVSRHAYPEAYDESLFAMLIGAYGDAEIDPADLARAAAAQIRHHPGQLARRLDEESMHALLQDGGGLRSLLLPLLCRGINVDVGLEPMLVLWRKRLAAWLDEGAIPSDEQLELLAGFATQAFNNEYVWPVSDSEAKGSEKALTRLVDLLRAGAPDRRAVDTALVRVALYDDPGTLGCVRECEAMLCAQDGPMRGLLAVTVGNRLDEERLARSLVRIGSIEDATSLEVKAQYEQNPYPRWVTIPRAELMSLAEYLSRRFPALGPEPLVEPLDVLVAGCGSGEEPLRIALGNPGARVVGIDLSQASLAYGLRSAARLGVRNLELMQGDLLASASLDKTFGVIFATGVLHHLEDPLTGWRALASCLAPRGLMRVALYSTAARASVNAFRRKFVAAGMSGTLSDIRAARAIILAGTDPESRELQASEDMYASSACRDLLFHVCEHQFSLPEIEAALEKLGLELLGIESPDPSAEASFARTDPQRSELERWASVEQASPQSFQGMYQFWVRRNDTNEL